MGKLEQLVSELDQLHQDLYTQYGVLLNIERPAHGFLNEDCYSPYGEEECYPSIEYALEGILTVLKRLKETQPAQIHAYLRSLTFYLEQMKQLFLPASADDSLRACYQELQAHIQHLRLFLTHYEYKLTKPYQTNTAILLTTLLYESVKQAFHPNIEPQQPVIKHNGVMLSLAEIAAQMSKATGVPSRNIQFIALGVTGEGKILATTNYHSPVVYPLECLLDKRLYRVIEQERSAYKVAHRAASGGTLIFTPKIHAETMIASLKTILDIRYILLIDGNGKKVQNCFCCSHYLCRQGFTSQPHIDTIQNYEVPTERHIATVADWVLTIKDKFPTQHTFVLPAHTTPSTASDDAQQMAQTLFSRMLDFLPHTLPPVLSEPELEVIFSTVKTHYPQDGIEGLYDTYHTANRLAHPEQRAISRTTARATRRHLNLRIDIPADSRIRISARGNRLSPVERGSPRTTELIMRVNTWLEAGDASVQQVEENGEQKFICKR